jgi:UDP-hydrolysing UDP-N-acetyl-D-glucosamine 2-epimerase
MAKKVMFFSGNRSEFGLMLPVIKRIKSSEDFTSLLVISGTHTDSKYGKTSNEIIKENIEINYEIPVKITGNSSFEVNSIISEIIHKANCILEKEKPDCVFILGDRYESYAFAIAAFFLRVPIAHMGGGAVTKGGCEDDVIRFSISQLASLHFVTCEENAKNLSKVVEDGERIVVSGSTAIENVLNEALYSREEIEKILGIDLENKLILFTLHPIPQNRNKIEYEVRQCLEALDEFGVQTIITYPNSDPGSDVIIEEYVNWSKKSNLLFYKNLGRKMYLSLLKLSSVGVGNSSSVILETPIFKIPGINIGGRQCGRVRSTNIIDVSYNKEEIINALETAFLDDEFRKSVSKCEYPFGKGDASQIVVKKLKEFLCIGNH